MGHFWDPDSKKISNGPYPRCQYIGKCKNYVEKCSQTGVKYCANEPVGTSYLHPVTTCEHKHVVEKAPA